MSLPRPVIPGETVMITRRCTQRQFLLRPNAATNQILLYCLAIAAERYGMLIHAFCFMSNHWHLVATDTRGQRPEFFRWFHEFSAKCLNATYGRWENLWASEQTSVVRLVNQTAQVDKLVYTLTNPVKAALVSSHELWPGAWGGPSDVGKALHIGRPKGFFLEGGRMPHTATLRVHKLPALEHLVADDYQQEMRIAIQTRESELRAHHMAAGQQFMGARRVVRQSPFASPATRERRRALSPRVACRNIWKRTEALQQLKAFLDAYRAAWQRYRLGDHDVIFPLGSYWLPVYAGARCSAPG